MNSIGKNENGPINLIDLAKILVKRRYFFLVPFTIILAIGAYLVLSKPDAYEFSSYYSVGVLEPGEFLEEPAELVLSVKEVLYPDIVDRHERESDKTLRLELVVENPENTGLIRILIVAPEHQSSEAKSIHEELMATINERQKEVYERQKNVHTLALGSIEKSLEKLSNSASGDFSLVTLWDKQGEIERSLEKMVPGQKVVTARKSENPVGVPKIVLVFGVVVAALVLGLISAYLTEFLCIVRDSLEQDRVAG